MKRVPVKKLQGGEVLAKDICTASSNILMVRGTILKKEYIDKLPILNIHQVYIEEQKSESEHSSYRISSATQEKIGECQDKVKTVLEHHIYKKNKELEELCEMTEEVIEMILKEEQISNYMIEMKEERNDMYAHSLNVCSLVTLLAFRLGMDKKFIIDIAKGGILHDIGLRYITVPYENRDIWKLSLQEQKEYKMHSTFGYKSLEDENWLSEQTKNIILMHHEYENGSGYPLHLTSEKIPIAVKIVSICEVFDELISGISYCHSKVQEAVEFLKYNSGRLFDKKYTEVFLSMIVHYPIGSIVRLNTGEMARVVQQNPEFNERPVLELLCDAAGKIYNEKKIMDLCRVLNVFIVNDKDNMR